MLITFDCFHPPTGKQLSVDVQGSSIEQAEKEALARTKCSVILSARVINKDDADAESIELLKKAKLA